jgi:hypothetical protein
MIRWRTALIDYIDETGIETMAERGIEIVLVGRGFHIPPGIGAKPF